ncbi:uncharacterized protein LOC111621012 [Centruroides sculpturatus]|uniref:uncharacterized protein LOC111621012 n=1 Tax=Centruroides sculpturatus TaxID=218467 RepID=UPI000C6E5274|nr:uncharacterized protein LOC111621012 [Centruroides sculpturatus]
MAMKLEKIHRVLEFKQSDWLKKYIDLNTEMRTKATNDFKKDFFKLMNNSPYGKTMENIRNRVDIRLCFFNKPIYVEMSILDLSKHLMYDFHYNVMKSKYGDNIKLLYQDTDSYIYDIKPDDIYQDMKEMIDYFDTSDYRENNQYCIPRENKKGLGKMKDENNGKIMREFVGLRAKMYALKVEVQVTKKSKGVKKCVVKNRTSFDVYKDCLFNKIEHSRTMNVIRSKKHKLYSIKVNKKALSPHNDKRYILEDGINTLALGHKFFLI